ncbi:MAG: methyltransferase domain-containing protein [Melioribacteraceae bacterium]|nr:methyltransferase domain-containing protein [Melioribacteraceae bacterium]MCF8354810.1 methyltransferase domain-containing protein [Melioribacteraceae bacterium]MCF8394559.1 methyltransferase domain-containing protein [Melioribacteraceae bacterium]MCF8420218.1 methyltransferase domain-containing protein [Melioribacteraceae bacterium]
MNTGITSADDIKKIVDGFKNSRIILSAFELNVFTVLDKKLLTSEEIAGKINADVRATDRLCNALTAIGLLHKRNNKFYNTHAASEFLVKGKPGYMGNLAHVNHTWNNWHRLTKSVIKGTSIAVDEINERGDDWLEAFIAAMHYRGEYQAKIISMMIDLKNVKRMLDVGGGSGAFSIGFTQAQPEMNAVVFDLPNVVQLTQRYIREAGMHEKISTVEGNYLTDDFGNGYDLILLSAIVHINSFDENEMLIKKCADALNPGGQVIIQDWIMNEERTAPPTGALFALNMLVGTVHGDTYTESEMKEWMTTAGLENIEKKDTGFTTSLLIGRKG